MILDLEKVASEASWIRGDEVVRVHDSAGQEVGIDCHVEVSARRVGETIYIHVDLSGELSTACHKCLERATCRVAPSFELVVQRAGPGCEPGPVSGDDEYIQLPRGVNQLSLDQHIYESLVVSIPIRICCSDECRGLCSGCGVNLNRETCRCNPAEDSRWEELRGLGDRLPG